MNRLELFVRNRDRMKDKADSSFLQNKMCLSQISVKDMDSF